MKTRLSHIALLSSCLLLSSQLPRQSAPVHRPGQARRRFRPDLQAGPERPEGRRPAQGADARHLHARRRRCGGLQRRGRPARRGGGTITAFSSGSLLNLAQGKFGRYDETAVRWLAAVGTDYGAISVRADAPYQDLDDLIAAVKKDPGSVVFGAGATIGGQDWMQTALIARAAGVDPKLRYVAFEGGGETLTAMLGGHVQVTSSGLGEVTPQLDAGKIRILAVLSDERLPGKLADIPTAKEQGLRHQLAGDPRLLHGRKSPTRTSTGGRASSTACWPTRTSPSCASSATCSRCR